MAARIFCLACPNCGDGYELVGPYDDGEERECARCGHIWEPKKHDEG